ncbi:hypothetical protein [Rhizobacter fulvus]
MSAVGKAAAGAVKLAGKSNLPLTVGAEGLLAGRDILTPGMTGIDQIGRVAEGAGRIGGAGIGALTGAAIGGLTGPLAPVVSPLLGIAGGAAGYFAPDAANRAFNFVTDGDNQLSSDRAEQLRFKPASQGIAAPPPKPIPAGDSRAGAGRGFVNPPPALAGGIADIYTRDGNSFTDGSASGSKSGYGVSTVGTDAAAVARGAASDRDLTALRASVANVNDATPGLGGFKDSATEERNARLARQNPLDRLESAARLGSSTRERATARSAYGQLAGTQDQGTTQQGIADISNLGQTIRASAKDRTDLARERMGNSVVMRGQDIGALTHAASDKNALGIAALRGTAAENVANINGAAQVKSADASRPRYMHVDGGQDIVMINGFQTPIKKPGYIVDMMTGQPVMPSQPPVGHVVNSSSGRYRFKGGDPAKKESWEAVAAGQGIGG